ncbi:MAG: hypothetical protein JXA37_04110 [Chloroflexia bacterium]|nr:hypothetical protein [Chloroflexia bacterium]
MPTLEETRPKESFDRKSEGTKLSDKLSPDKLRFSKKTRDYNEPYETDQFKDQTDIPVFKWNPKKETREKIKDQVEANWSGEGNRPIEGKGVEAACQYLREYIGVKTMVVSRQGGGADILALDQEGQLIVAEVKASNSDNPTYLRGDIGRNGKLTGRLVSRAHKRFLLSGYWLKNYKKKMEQDIRRKMSELAPEDRGPYKDLEKKVRSARFLRRDTYRRMVFFVGSDLRFGAVKAYDEKVQPESYCWIDA